MTSPLCRGQAAFDHVWRARHYTVQSMLDGGKVLTALAKVKLSSAGRRYLEQQKTRIPALGAYAVPSQPPVVPQEDQFSDASTCNTYVEENI